MRRTLTKKPGSDYAGLFSSSSEHWIPTRRQIVLRRPELWRALAYDCQAGLRHQRERLGLLGSPPAGGGRGPVGLTERLRRRAYLLGSALRLARQLRPGLVSGALPGRRYI